MSLHAKHKKKNFSQVPNRETHLNFIPLINPSTRYSRGVTSKQFVKLPSKIRKQIEKYFEIFGGEKKYSRNFIVSE